MPLPVTFANLPTGNNPASLLDQSFLAVANMGTTYCTATGTNTILLTVAPNQPIPTSYANGDRFNFIAPATNTGAVTIQVGSLAALPLRSGGQPVSAGFLVAGTICEAVISGGGTTADLVPNVSGFLPLAGGTLSGGLVANGGYINTTSSTSNASMTLTKAAGLFGNYINGYTTSYARWQIALGNNAQETGSNVGSDLTINRYNDAGTSIDTPIGIKRSTGVTTFSVAIVNGPSDRTLKENIAPLDGAIDKVKALQGVSFNMKATPEKREIGLIAQDVESVIPEVIQPFGPEEEGKLAIDYPRLVAVLIEAVKTLTARVEALEAAR